MDWRLAIVLSLFLCAGGCQSPYRSDQGALMGGVLGAGTGAIVGDAVGDAGAGAVIGAGIGAITGGVIGNEMDRMEAENRAMISRQMGRQVAAGAVTTTDVTMMTSSGVDNALIINHVRAHGMAAPLNAHDLVQLQNAGVSTEVIAAMQEPPRRVAQPVATRAPVIVQEHHYGAPCYGPPPYRHGWVDHGHHDPGVHWGVTFGH